jgi:hypothetical protein
MTSRDQAGLRREFRAWVRAHHPDAGGDPGEFAAGLRRWRHRLAPGPGGAAPDVTVFRTGGLWMARRWWQRRRQPSRVR